MSLAQYSKEQLKELSLIELAYEYLKNHKEPIAFADLINEIATAADISEDEIRARLAQFYTDLNIDGRFLSRGDNHWGLRVWFPVDTIEEEVITASVKAKKKKAKKVLDDEEMELDDFDELEEEDYDDLDDFTEEDDLLDDEDEFEDEIEELEEFEEEEEEEEIIEDDEDFDLVEDEELDDDLDEDLEEEDEPELDEEEEDEDL